MGLFDNLKSAVKSAVAESLSDTVSKLTEPDIEARKQEAQALVSRAQQLYKSGKYQEALDAMELWKEKLKTIESGEELAKGIQVADKSIEDIRSKMNSASDFEARKQAAAELMSKAQQLFQSGNYQESIDTYELWKEKFKTISSGEDLTKVTQMADQAIAMIRSKMEEVSDIEALKEVYHKAVQLAKSGGFQESIDTIELYREKSKTVLSGENLMKAEQLVDEFSAGVRKVMDTVQSGNATASVSMPAFCASCGTKLNDGAKFCPGCGTPVV